MKVESPRQVCLRARSFDNFRPTAERPTEATLAETPQPDEDRDELDLWVRATVQPALAYAVSLVQDHAAAEDLVHDCYCRLLAKAEDYDLPRDGRKLLFKAVTNACINWTQRRPPVVQLSQEACSNQGFVGPEQALMERELEEAIGAALAELDVRQRAVVELQAMGHLLGDVAEMLEISQSNTRVLLHRARKQLAKRLRPFLEE